MRDEIILMGPMASGKSTLSRALSQILEKPHLDLDTIKWDYFAFFGYHEKEASEAFSRDGIRGLHDYYKIFEFKTLKRIFSKYKGCIFDLGAGFTAYENRTYQSKVNSLLANFSNKFILLPHKNFEHSDDILTKRFSKRFHLDNELENIMNSTPNFNLNYNFLKFYYDNQMSCQIIYTAGRTIESAANEIIEHLNN
ncbi:MAG: hypothetical protein K2X39_00255 [Silvanigrellaceae bacterium]|nr:hypothetical protein [Silvanigrellaceae bacterium]